MKLQVTVHDHKLHFCKLYGEHNQCSLEIMSNDYLLIKQTCHYCIAGASPDDMMPLSPGTEDTHVMHAAQRDQAFELVIFVQTISLSAQ